MSEKGADSLELVSPEPVSRSGRPGYQRAADKYGHLGISRRTVFRWLELGDAAADWPPLDDPAKLESWWERMRERGLARNRLPDDVFRAIQAQKSADVPPPVAAESKNEQPAAGPVATADAQPARPGAVEVAVFDPQAELRQAEARLVALREARDTAYAAEKLDEGNRLDRQYWEKYGEYTVVAKRVAEYLEKRGELVSRASVEAELVPRIVGIAVGGMFFFGRIQSQLAAAPDLAAQNAVWRAFWREQVGTLMQARFVPDFLRNSPETLWADVLAFIESRRPPDLRLQ